MNFYKRYMADYQSKTSRLTLIEHGAYTLLLDEYYVSERGLPAELDGLYRICRAMNKAEQAAVRAVAEQFFPVGEDGLRHNPRASVEIGAAAPSIEAARLNGMRGGRPRKKPSGFPDQKPSGFQDGNPDGSENETQNEPRTKAPQSSDISTSLRSVEMRASRLPADWSLPDEWRAWALTERPDLNPERTAASFADYWRGKAGKDGRKVDWLATWRNWVRNERTQAQRRQTSEPKYAAAARSIFGVTTPQQEIVDVTPR